VESEGLTFQLVGEPYPQADLSYAIQSVLPAHEPGNVATSLELFQRALDWAIEVSAGSECEDETSEDVVIGFLGELVCGRQTLSTLSAGRG
jgi:hypothetical protein